MLNRIKLKNFGCHEELDVQFGRGFQLIKGDNEKGKSTLILGVVYAFGGARALPKTLARMVTWGKPEASLRVDLEFTHAGQEFKIYRHKGGAEITGPGVTASGQDEVTKFVNGLFGITQDMLPKLLMAKQADLKSSLAGGSSVALIETLSGMGLIDELVGLIQTELPSGNVKPIQALLDTEAKREAPAAPDTTALEAEVLDAKGKGSAVLSQADAAAAERAGLDLAGAQRVLDQTIALQDVLTKGRAAVARAEETLAALPPADTAPSQLDRLREKQTAARQRAFERQATQEAWVDFQKRYTGEDVWEGTSEALETQIRTHRLEAEMVTSDGANIAKRLGVAEGSLIKAGECSFCGKLLDGVPEVVAKNAELGEQIANLLEQQAAGKNRLAEVSAESAVMTRVLNAHLRQEGLFSQSGLVTADKSVVPHRYAWAGPDMSAPAPVEPTFDEAIRQEEARLRAAAKAETDRAAAVATLKANRQSVATAEEQLAGLDGQAAKELQARGAALAAQEQALRQTAARHKAAEGAAQSRLRDVAAAFEEQKRAYQVSLVRRDELKATLAEMALHNGIITKLRDARPEVAKRLWAAVEGAISHHFSRIRGAPSLVTRGDDGFTVDGHPADDHSGSTTDGLGLAIRIGLTKTFLPACRFMILDEPAAAASDARETNMLGALAGADYDQIIMVTHSTLADAFADNIIQL